MTSAQEKYQQKKQKYSQLQREYENRGSLSWSEFNANQHLNQGKEVLLKKSDFQFGTLRVHQPCLLKLTESIQFNPNRPVSWLDSQGKVTGDVNQARALDPNRCGDWLPDPLKPRNEQYFEPEVSFAYGLGFFAALAIEAPRVIVDLNGFTLEQHPEHLLQQRFYANIELADQPFIPFQGPSNFGATLRSAKEFYLHNGKLGRSSHHAVHGNNNTDVLFDNLVIENFEVASLHLNGGHDIVIHNINVTKNSQAVPVLATYSAGRFLKLFANRLAAKGLTSTGVTQRLAELNAELDATFNSVIFRNGSVPQTYANPSGQIDGNPYGMVINPTGVAVNGFLPTRQTWKSNETGEITILNSNINGISGRVNEIPALARVDPNGQLSRGVVVDTAGALVQVLNGVARVEGDRYYYQGTSLSNLQIEIAELKHQNPQSARAFGTLNIDRAFVVWAKNPQMYLEHNLIDTFTLKLANHSDYQEEGHSVQYRVLGNGDSMFHVDKGVMGLRIDGANGWTVQNVTISNIKNTGLAGTTLAGNYVKSHPAQHEQKGYNGNDTYGLVASATNNGRINGLQVLGVTATTGTAKGLTVQYDSCNLDLGQVLVRDVNGGAESTWTPAHPSYPNKAPQAFGVLVTGDCYHVNTDQVTVENVTGKTGSEKIALMSA